MGNIRKIANSFWLGLGDAIKFIAVLLFGVCCMAAILLMSVFFAATASYVMSCCGVFTGFLFILDIVLIGYTLSCAKFKGNIFIRLAKGIGLALMMLLILMFINVVIWTFGSIWLWLFGASLSIGATMAVGLGFVVAIALILLLVIYIRDCGWHRTVELLMRILGMLIIPGLIGLLIYFLL